MEIPPPALAPPIPHRPRPKRKHLLGIPRPRRPAALPLRNDRWRRIVRYPPRTHVADVAVPPAWHQWLRHTRQNPPTLAEQRAEVARRERMRLLAAQADARWEAKPKVMEDVATTGDGRRRIAGVEAPGPALETERDLGPGSQVKMEERKAGEREGKEEVEEVTLGDNEVVDQREETWRRMREEEEKGNGKGKGKAEGKDPWKQVRGGPSETWQPKGWEPAAGGKK
ncbi:hypothetical protein NEMBOFW57_000891 [Staphylotrichum longicolle]|uniref:NADH dehydrogenase [ubiquinone] 1 alpha subcomplex subunit n=1 Tax=Staphylotrichum longicolle TaxID=669026 RepID=A0AAD4F0M6_9PEZI|nr:hypothetical protein NEMBOFW57_000891 [Staphylotrichum longicolle]